MIQRIRSVESVIYKRMSRGASDENLISWLEGLKSENDGYFNSIMDDFIDAIRQTPLTKKEKQ